MWKHFISGYLSFTKKERTGISVLLLLLVFILLLPFLFPFFIRQKMYDHSSFEKEIAALQIKRADSSDQFLKRKFEKQNNTNYYPAPGKGNDNWQPRGELFYFDPNSASTLDWKKLGVRDKTITTIQNYLAKGGKFYKKEDIGKIWGLHENEVQRLMPYIQIQNNHLTNYPEKPYEKKEYKTTLNTSTVIDINTADTAAWIALPGIGSKLSQRIINFRDKLGGFYAVEQIGETFGLPDSTFQKIKPRLKISNPDELKRININTASIDEMKSHPYLRYALANAIVQYRNQHGNYAAVPDIRKIMAVTKEVFIRVAPYLTVN